MDRKSVSPPHSTTTRDQHIIADCNYNFEEALKGKKIPPEIVDQLALVKVEYYSFDGKIHSGQLIINKELRENITEIFNEIKKIKFPVAKVIPVTAYRWSDSASMADNNTSAFNYRFIKGTRRISNHALGRAIDINPLLNPQIKKDEILPSSGSYKPRKPGTLTKNSKVVQFFIRKGWTWGGEWKSSKDYQHFEKSR